MDITVNKTVSYEVEKIVIRAIMLNLFNNKLEISAPYEWKDINGVILKRNVQRISEEQLLAMDAGNSVLIGKLKAILPSDGIMKNMVIIFGETVTARSNYKNPLSNKWEPITYTQEQLETLLNGQGLSVEGVQTIVSGLATTLT